VFLATAKANNLSLKAHRKPETIARYLKPPYKKIGKIEKSLKKLCSPKICFLAQHPTGGGVTYRLTKKGREYAMKWFKEHKKW